MKIEFRTHEELFVQYLNDNNLYDLTIQRIVDLKGISAALAESYLLSLANLSSLFAWADTQEGDSFWRCHYQKCIKFIEENKIKLENKYIFES